MPAPGQGRDAARRTGLEQAGGPGAMALLPRGAADVLNMFYLRRLRGIHPNMYRYFCLITLLGNPGSPSVRFVTGCCLLLERQTNPLVLVTQENISFGTVCSVPA